MNSESEAFNVFLFLVPGDVRVAVEVGDTPGVLHHMMSFSLLI